MRWKLHFYYPDILNLLGAQIDPRVENETNTVVKFLDDQKGYEHFAVKPLRDYQPRRYNKLG